MHVQCFEIIHCAGIHVLQLWLFLETGS